MGAGPVIVCCVCDDKAAESFEKSGEEAISVLTDHPLKRANSIASAHTTSSTTTLQPNMLRHGQHPDCTLQHPQLGAERSERSFSL